ncbi:MAG: type II toxin-antitoxin system HicA family toxin [Candidatus Eremiobacteraeota bacterium]|nr:type II toxin-antitoxin system HicA family toxin [Candidatus Eremiobacteraeota bacterium]
MRPELKNITARKLVNALEKDGFKLAKGRGGHRVYYNPDHRIVVVPFHRSGDTFPIGTLSSMLKSIKWTENDLRRLGLFK